MTTGIYYFVSFILNVAFVGVLTARSASLVALLVITQFSGQVEKDLFHS